jgi:hypothetical protein
MMTRQISLKTWLLLISLAGHACVYPTDDSAALTVDMAAIPDLLEGEVYRLTGTVQDPQGNPLPNVEIVYSASDPQVAVVGSGGEMLATGPGYTTITAAAVGFANATPATAEIKIHNLIEIDSVRPRIVRYGDSLHLFGAGLNPEPFGPGNEFIGVFIGNVDAKPSRYLPEDPDAPNRFGRLTVWVPPPAPEQALVGVFGVNGLAIDEADTLRIFPFDIYEPNDTEPWDFGPVSGIIRNPALAFEKRPRGDSIGGDWYRFEQTTVGDRTLVIRSDQVGPDGYQVFFTDSLWFNGSAADFELGSKAWTIGPGLYVCQGVPFAAPQFPADSVLIAIRDLPVGTYDLIASYSQFGAYELAILPTYRSQLPPDPAEENDYCDVATPFVVGQSRTLTIDNPHDVDWFRFNLASPQNVVFDVTAMEQEADLDVYVLGNYLPDSLPVLAVSQIGGVSDGVTASLTAGDYFLVVVDFVGVPTEYEITSLASMVVAAPHASATVPAARPGGVGPWILRRPE